MAITVWCRSDSASERLKAFRPSCEHRVSLWHWWSLRQVAGSMLSGFKPPTHWRDWYITKHSNICHLVKGPGTRYVHITTQNLQVPQRVNFHFKNRPITLHRELTFIVCWWIHSKYQPIPVSACLLSSSKSFRKLILKGKHDYKKYKP